MLNATVIYGNVYGSREDVTTQFPSGKGECQLIKVLLPPSITHRALRLFSLIPRLAARQLRCHLPTKKAKDYYSGCYKSLIKTNHWVLYKQSFLLCLASDEDKRKIVFPEKFFAPFYGHSGVYDWSRRLHGCAFCLIVFNEWCRWYKTACTLFMNPERQRWGETMWLDLKWR